MSKRILFLVPCGSFWPSGVRRVIDYLPFLGRDGFSCSVKSYRNERLARALALGRVNGPWAHLWRSVLSRPIVDKLHSARVLLTIAATASDVDVVFVQSIPPPPWWVRLIKRRGPRVVFDFDDAVFLHNPERVGYVVAHADVVVAGSHFNLEYARGRSNRAVLIPTPVPLDTFHAANGGPDTPDGYVNIGWMGGQPTMKYLELLSGPLRELARRFPKRVRFTVVGCGNRCQDVPGIEGVDLVIVPRIEPKDVPKVIETFDIGVMPLFDGDWERGKCSLKMLEYMAASVPAVGSAVGENLYVIQDGVNGFLAGTPDEWVGKLGRLIESPEMRRTMGERGRQTVEEKVLNRGLLSCAQGSGAELMAVRWL